jgi:hypothetical protein
MQTVSFFFGPAPQKKVLPVISRMVSFSGVKLSEFFTSENEIVLQQYHLLFFEGEV